MGEAARATILVVVPALGSLIELTDRLQARGYKVVAMSEPGDAIAYLVRREASAQVIVLDWDDQGIAALRFLVLHHFAARGGDTPIVVLADRTAQLHVPRRSVTRVVPKPVTGAELEDVVARLVARTTGSVPDALP